MAFKLTIDTQNLAFETHDEITRILHVVAERWENGETEGRIRDINGNAVGSFAYTEGEY